MTRFVDENGIEVQPGADEPDFKLEYWVEDRGSDKPASRRWAYVDLWDLWDELDTIDVGVADMIAFEADEASPTHEARREGE